MPPFGVESPVVAHLLDAWTHDETKLEYLRKWLRYLIHDKLPSLPPGFTPGVQLLGLRPEIKDGFVVLLLPMLRHARPELEILVRKEGREGGRERGRKDETSTTGRLTPSMALTMLLYPPSLPPSLPPFPPSLLSLPSLRYTAAEALLTRLATTCELKF